MASRPDGHAQLLPRELPPVLRSLADDTPSWGSRVKPEDIRSWSRIVAILALFGEGMGAVILCLTWTGSLDIHRDIGDNICRWLILLSTLLCIAALIQYYTLFWHEAWARKHSSSSLQRSPCILLNSPWRIKGALIFETMVLLIFPPPLLNLSETAVTDLCMFMSLRMWFFGRFLRDSTPEHVAAVQARRMLGSLASHTNIPWTFALRATFARKPWQLLAYLVFSIYGLTGLFIWVAERNVQPGVFDLWESFWFIGVTMTTVGYGDRSPKSAIGQVLALLTCVAGINCTALLVTVTTSTFTLKPHEDYLITSIELGQAARAERDAAARFVQFWWRNRSRNQELVMTGHGQSFASRGVRNALQVGRSMRLSIDSSTRLGRLRHCRQKRRAALQSLHAADFQRNTEERLDELGKGQREIMARLERLEHSISSLVVTLQKGTQAA